MNNPQRRALKDVLDDFISKLLLKKIIDPNNCKANVETIKNFYEVNFRQILNQPSSWLFFFLNQRNYIVYQDKKNITFNKHKIKSLAGDSKGTKNSQPASRVQKQKNQPKRAENNAPPNTDEYSVHIEDASFPKEDENNVQFILTARYEGNIKSVASDDPRISISKFDVQNRNFKISGSKDFETLGDTVEIKLRITTARNQVFNYTVPADITRHGKQTDFVIKGVNTQFISNAALLPESKPLYAHKIPKKFDKKLWSLARQYPEFIERMPDLRDLTSRLGKLKISDKSDLNQLQNAFFSECSKRLSTPIKLKESNYTDMLQKLLDIEEYQMQIDIHYYDRPGQYFTKPAVIKFEREYYNSFRDRSCLLYQMEIEGLAEGRPSLLKNDSVYVRPEKSKKVKYEGVVHKIRANTVVLAFNYMFGKVHVRAATNQKFSVEFGFNRRPLRVQKQAVDLVKVHDIVPYFFPDYKKVDGGKPSTKEVNFFNKNLNGEQQRAVRNILETKNAPYLIFGPPGTGKTITVVEAVCQVWKYKPSSNILICTPSNAAAEVLMKLLENVIQKMDLYRLYGHTYGETSRTMANVNEGNTNIKDGQMYFPGTSFLKNKRVILTTLVTATRLVNAGVAWRHFTHVFIDEGGYATETESLLPIVGILSNEKNKKKICGQFVIAGDPRQLGPRIHSNFNKFCGFDTSMLERLIDTCEIYARDEKKNVPYDERFITKLLINYRSHESILRASNELFYHNELKTANDNFSQLFTEWEHLPSKGFPVIFSNVVGEDKQDKSSPSFFNDAEVKEVMKYLDILLKDTVIKGIKLKQENVAVITPYKRQIEKIENECKKRGFTKVKIGTVQIFQGRENLVTIISTVRSQNASTHQLDDEFYDLGLLKSPKRFNVATTRAKSLLVVVGNGSVLKLDRCWRHFLKHCIENKAVVGPKVVLCDDDAVNEASGIFAGDDEGPDFSAGNI